MLGRDAGKSVVELRIDKQDAGPGVRDDVADLFRAEPEVHRHQDAAVARDTEEGSQQARRVVRDDGDAFTDIHSQLVEARGLTNREIAHVFIGQSAQRFGRLVGFVDDPHPAAVHDGCPVDEVSEAERERSSLLRSSWGRRTAGR